MKTDSTVVPDVDLAAMLQLIKDQSAILTATMDHLQASAALIDKLTARLLEYEWAATHVAVLSKTPACVAPNGWN
jgi:hypothetical protein